MSFIIFLITSGVPGLLTYIYLRETSNIGNQDDFMKKCTLSALSILSLIIFLLFYGWNMQEYKLNNLIKNFDLIYILLTLFQTLAIIFLISILILPALFRLYSSNINKYRKSRNLTKKNSLSVIEKLFEDESHLIFIELYDYENNKLKTKGWLINFEITNQDQLNLTVKPCKNSINEDKFKDDITEKLKYINSEQNYIIEILKLKKQI